MRRTVLTILISFFAGSIFAQGKFERRIIVRDSLFYGIEIENQVGKLYIGNIGKPIDSAKIYALPAGTRRRTSSYLPFAWDIDGDTVYTVNFTEYAQNNLLKSFKSISLKNLEAYDPQKINVQLRQGAFANSKILNWPLVNTIKKYTYMDDLFFDVLIGNGVVYQVLSVKDELTIWTYKNGTWEQSDAFPFDAQKYFSAYIFKNELHLVNSKGESFVYRNKIIQEAKPGFPLSEMILIDDRNAGRTYFVNVAVFEQTSSSIQSILDKAKKD